ncbi:MAG TPA: nuclear transport factor 2 family protein, partial [Acidimicrobiales bacterium]|nr:nuclear transport factor 2 family protein [Acidimicrobiales bacterium]
MREANLTLVRSAYEAFGKGDFDTLRTLMADDVVWHTPGIYPFEVDYKGVDGVLGYFTKLFELTDGTIRVEPEHMLADDDRVVVLERVTGTRLGHHIDFHDVVVYEISGGKQTA